MAKSNVPSSANSPQPATFANPNIPAIVPFSSATLWRSVKAGKFPPPVKLSDRVTAWRVEDVRAWMKSRAAAA